MDFETDQPPPDAFTCVFMRMLELRVEAAGPAPPAVAAAAGDDTAPLAALRGMPLAEGIGPTGVLKRASAAGTEVVAIDDIPKSGAIKIAWRHNAIDASADRLACNLDDILFNNLLSWFCWNLCKSLKQDILGPAAMRARQ